MRKFFTVLFTCSVFLSPALANDIISNDTADPLYKVATEHVLSRTTLTYWDQILRAGQYLSYGVNDSLVVSANIHYQEEFSSSNDGFSSFDLGGFYRVAVANSNQYGVISDVLFGLKVGGSSHVRTPDYAEQRNLANSTYYLGMRLGRQMEALTLSATVKSSWIFDSTQGMAFIDFMPEAYFRIHPDWRFGLKATLRKATNSDFNQQWVGAKLVRQFGSTQYVGHIDYEFESNNTQVGVQLNILF